MTSKRVSAPFDLRAELQSDDDEPKKQTIASPPKPITAPPRPAPPKKSFTNGLFRPLSDKQVDMLEREYYTDKNMVGRDKLCFIQLYPNGSAATVRRPRKPPTIGS